MSSGSADQKLLQGDADVSGPPAVGVALPHEAAATKPRNGNGRGSTGNPQKQKQQTSSKNSNSSSNSSKKSSNRSSNAGTHADGTAAALDGSNRQQHPRAGRTKQRKVHPLSTAIAASAALSDGASFRILQRSDAPAASTAVAVPVAAPLVATASREADLPQLQPQSQLQPQPQFAGLSESRRLMQELQIADEDLKQMVARKGSYYDAAVMTRVCTIRHKYAQLIKKYPRACAKRDIAFTMWKSTIYRFIEEFRSSSKRDSMSATFEYVTSDASSFLAGISDDLDEGDEYQRQIIAKLLMYRGDIARYREQYLPERSPAGVGKKALRDWSFCKDLYRRASMLMPGWGIVHNQLGVISGYEKDDMETLFQYILALSVEDPFANAADNLKTSAGRVLQQPQGHPFTHLMAALVSQISLDRIDGYLRNLLASLDAKQFPNEDVRLATMACYALHKASAEKNDVLRQYAEKVFDTLFAMFCHYGCVHGLVVLCSYAGSDGVAAFLTSAKFIKLVIEASAAAEAAGAAPADRTWRSAVRGIKFLSLDGQSRRSDLLVLVEFAVRHGVSLDLPAAVQQQQQQQQQEEEEATEERQGDGHSRSRGATSIPAGKASAMPSLASEERENPYENDGEVNEGGEGGNDKDEDDDEDIVLVSSLDDLNFDQASEVGVPLWAAGAAAAGGVSLQAVGAAGAMPGAGMDVAGGWYFNPFFSGPAVSRPPVPAGAPGAATLWSYDPFGSFPSGDWSPAAMTMTVPTEMGRAMPPMVSYPAPPHSTAGHRPR